MDPFKSLVWDQAVHYFLREVLLKSIPFLSGSTVGGLLGGLITEVLTVMLDRLYDALKLNVKLELIVLRNEESQRAFQDASVRLKIAAHDHGPDSEEFKKIHEETKTAFSKFVRFGIAPI